ncbi:protein kinase [Streptacidiphilus sp. NEAU-YB345]|uniref:Protein kinase n=1 Tax=Streptacidiphilus fuscans TaxID=2789292 RepID=A0A931B3D2_9ACTN|nr:protein kinase [Streptacidiphilus fuscans]
MGPYQLVGRLGVGGMGRVYLGRSKGGRLVAVKVVRQDLVDEPGFRDRFIREVNAARLVNALYTAGVVDAAHSEDDAVWMATAYVPGVTLSEGVATHGPLAAPAVTALGAGLAEALAAIHAVGVFHRDLKPSNVLLATDGPRVIDFGISVVTDASALTDTGALIGTPGFMSPEQLTGQPFGPASDVFSLAAVLAYAATGQSPFGTGPAHSLMYRIVHEEPDLTDVPDPLRGLLGDCLAKEPAQRPTVAGVLEQLTAPGPSTAADPRLAFGTGWLPADIVETIQLRATPVPVTPDGRVAPLPPVAAADHPATAPAHPGHPGQYPAGPLPGPRQAAPVPTPVPPQPMFGQPAQPGQYGQQPPITGRPAPWGGAARPTPRPRSRANTAAAVTSGVLALVTAAMLAWFALCNITGESTTYWSSLAWENVLGGFVSAALLVPSAAFTFARRLPGAWTLCAQCVVYVVSIFVMNPVLQGTGFGPQLDFVLGFHRSNGIAIGLAAIFGLLTAITAAIAGSVTSPTPARQG